MQTSDVSDSRPLFAEGMTPLHYAAIGDDAELIRSLIECGAGDNVRKDQIKSGAISFNEEHSPFAYVDLFKQGPATVVSWTSSYSETGVLGEAELATAEKGQRAYDEAVKQLVTFVRWFKERPKDERRDLHRRPPTMAIPWGQTESGD